MGQGVLELLGFARGGWDTGTVGARLEYLHRATDSLSLVGGGGIFRSWGESDNLGWEASGGLRWRF